jgi:PKD domain
MRRRILLLLLPIAVLLVVAGAAQAIVLDMGASGRFGVALVPSERGGEVSVPAVTSAPPCSDPWLSIDLTLPPNGLCWHGGPVMHRNETFTLAWDPMRRYWATARNYVETFLSNVAGGSGQLTSPYAVTGQYSDAQGRAAYASAYGGGCIDFGATGGSACKFGNASGNGPGHDYGTNGCTPNGFNHFHEDQSGAFDSVFTDNVPDDICVTDVQIRAEVAHMVSDTGLLGRAKAGFTPMVMLLTPPGVETCLDAAGSVCSANSQAPASFCSYHSQVNVGGTNVSYVVQPWTALTGCDEPDAPVISLPLPPVDVFATEIAIRLVSPLSQGQLAAITDPALTGWYGLDGSEINDNGCVPFANHLDQATVGGASYLLQREFNNAGVIESDPNALVCTPNVLLGPRFVIPSAVNPGDVVEFDGATTVSSLIIPRANYFWSFGDGTRGVGPSVVHIYGSPGTYTVQLTVVDRGGNTSSLNQQITVGHGSGGSGPPPPGHRGLRAHIQLIPQGLRSVLRTGVALRVSSNEPADGIATLLVSRKTASRAKIRHGRGATVVIGRGTVRGIKNGTVRLRLRVSRAVAAKLRHLGHVSLTVRLSLFAAGGEHLAIDAAGRY